MMIRTLVFAPNGTHYTTIGVEVPNGAPLHTCVATWLGADVIKNFQDAGFHAVADFAERPDGNPVMNVGNREQTHNCTVGEVQKVVGQAGEKPAQFSIGDKVTWVNRRDRGDFYHAVVKEVREGKAGDVFCVKSEAALYPGKTRTFSGFDHPEGAVCGRFHLERGWVVPNPQDCGSDVGSVSGPPKPMSPMDPLHEDMRMWIGLSEMADRLPEDYCYARDRYMEALVIARLVADVTDRGRLGMLYVTLGENPDVDIADALRKRADEYRAYLLRNE